MKEKVSKSSVNYQDAPKNGQKCDQCSMWIQPNGCTAVRGVISNNGWCKIYERKNQ